MLKKLGLRPTRLSIKGIYVCVFMTLMNSTSVTLHFPYPQERVMPSYYYLVLLKFLFGFFNVTVFLLNVDKYLRVQIIAGKLFRNYFVEIFDNEISVLLN